MIRAAALTVFCISLSVMATAPTNAQPKAASARLVIGSGGVGGVYYAAGRELCRLVNRQTKKIRLRCSLEATPGSLYNLRSLRTGELDVALAQSDWQYHAWKGSNRFAQAGPDGKLRSAFSLHRETFTVIAGPDSGVKTLADLSGKRVNIGPRGSGHRATARFVFRRLKWNDRSFAALTAFGTAKQTSALCDRKIDALVLLVGHPNHVVSEALKNCRARIIPLSESLTTGIADDTPYYDPAPIRGRDYGLKESDIWSFGTTTTVSISEELLPETVYNFTRAVFEQVKSLRRAHPALSGLTQKNMATQGMTAPLHEGAIRYFKEKKLR